MAKSWTCGIAAALSFAACDLAVAAEVSLFPDPSDRLMAVLIFFGVKEDGAGTERPPSAEMLPEEQWRAEGRTVRPPSE